MRCGRPAELQPTAPDVARSCPRCRQPLRTRTLSGAVLGSVTECGGCGGVWLTPEMLDRMCASAEAMQEATNALLAGRPPRAPPILEKVVYVPCPDCKDLMVRRNFGGDSGVIVDVCGRHGVWFDHAELEKVLAFVRGGGLMRARRREVDRLEKDALRAREQRTTPFEVTSAPLYSGPEYHLGDLFGDLLNLVRRRR
jgi:Zn-finger nucleic acid-binding protein